MIPINDVQKVGGKGVEHGATPKKPQKKALFADGSPMTKLATTVLTDAAIAGTSVVHIEPHHASWQIRYRIDGVLHKGKALSPDALLNLIVRLKALSGIDVNETRLAQQGRFDTILNSRPYLIRVNTLPIEGGEKLVVHLAEQSNEAPRLETLGYWGAALQTLQRATEAMRGLVLVGGPAGSGKTATLYGLLGIAVDPSLSATTVENIVEHRLTGVTHTPVPAHESFAHTLRAVLNQDPNLILLSDIKDADTANQAMHAALGRMFVAGLQSTDLAASIAHLEAMGVPPYVLASSLRAIANQRLVRQLCQTCRQDYMPNSKEFDALCTAMGLGSHGARSHLTNLQSVAAADLKAKPVSFANGKLGLWRASEQGCDDCGGRGYKGRIVIAEVLDITPAVQALIMSHASGKALYDHAIQHGMVPLPLDGLVKVVLGLTSVEEVLQATRI